WSLAVLAACGSGNATPALMMPTSTASDSVEIDAAKIVGSSLRVSLAGSVHVLSRERLDRRSQNDLTWIGTAANSDDYAVLVVRGERVTGTIHIDHTSFDVSALGGRAHRITRAAATQPVDLMPSTPYTCP